MKFGNKSITAQVIHQSISGFHVALESLFSGLLALAQEMLSSTRVGNLGNEAQLFGYELYKNMYFEFQSAMKR